VVDQVTGNFSEEPIFYVYIHKRKDTNSIFYVGKGKDRRAWSTRSRNPHWVNTVNKYGYIVEIIHQGLTEKEAFNLEISTIALYGIDNLTNLTIGGNTTSGFKHSDSTKRVQREITNKRRLDNPSWAQDCDARMQELVLAQNKDNSFRKMVAEINKQNYNNLSAEGKEEYISKRTAWMNDPDKKKSAIDKFILTCSTPEFKEKQSQATKAAWENMSEDTRKLRSESSKIIWDNSEFKAKLLEMRSYKIVVNRRFIFDSIKDFSRKVGNSNSLYTTLSEAIARGYSFTVFKGILVEHYNPDIHSNATKYNREVLQKLPTKIMPKNNAVVMDDELVFTSFKAAADYFGDQRTDSTPEWISKCMKNSLPAMGHNWRKATIPEIELEILKQLDAVYLDTAELNTEGTNGY